MMGWEGFTSGKGIVADTLPLHRPIIGRNELCPYRSLVCDIVKKSHSSETQYAILDVLCYKE